MNYSRFRYAAFLSTILLVGMIATPLLLTWRAVKQQQLNHDLVVAVKEFDTKKATQLLDAGADANTTQTQDQMNCVHRTPMKASVQEVPSVLP